MAHFASLDAENKVVKVHCVDNKQLLDVDGTESEEYGIMYLRVLFGGGRYKQTSYNTRGGVHHDGDGQPDDGIALRANYCGKGWVYNEEHDIFHPQQPFPSWTLDEIKGQWISPVPYPEIEPIEGEPHTMYQWNEDNQNWDKTTQ
jgi:hypothetical protein